MSPIYELELESAQLAGSIKVLLEYLHNPKFTITQQTVDDYLKNYLEVITRLDAEYIKQGKRARVLWAFTKLKISYL